MSSNDENQDGTPLSDKENSKRKRNSISYNDNNDNDESDDGKLTKTSKKSSKKRVNYEEEEDEDEYKNNKKAARKAKSALEDDWIPSQSQSQIDGEEDFQLDEREVDYEAGQILTIEVENFMCHRRMTVTLNRGLNFITGQNGSGKSAIAAAIQLVCGANTKDTGRGKSLGNLIREGSDGPAVLTIKLLNSGVDAYKDLEYGNRIYIERKITKSGTSSYRMMNHERELVSSDKKELQKMLQHFNIYPDNPMNVLTQEDSKKFINGKEGDKYEFFLKASGLRKVREELSLASEEMEEAKKNIGLIENRLDTKKANRDLLKRELEQFQKLGEISAKIEMANAKLLWVPYHKLVAIIDKLKDKLVADEREYEDALSQLSACEAAANETGSLDETKEKIEAYYKESDEVEEQVASKFAEINAKQKQVAASKKNVDELKKSIDDYKIRKRNVRKDIEDLRKKAASGAKGDEKRLIEDIGRSTRSLDELKERQAGLQGQKQQLNQDLLQFQDDYKSAQDSSRTVMGEIRDLENELRSLKAPASKGAAASKFSDSARFHPAFPKVLEDIEKTNFAQPPIGPLGMYIQVKSSSDPKWGHAIETVVGGMLKTFIVQSFDDQKKLQAILRKHNLGMAVSIRVEKNPRTTRYNNVQVPKINGVETVMDQLIFTNDIVFNTIVSVCSINSTVLVLSSRPEHINPYKSQGRLKDNIRALMTMDAWKITFYGNGNMASDPSHFKFSRLLKIEGRVAADNSDLIIQKQAAINDEKERLAQNQEIERHALNNVNECRRNIDQINQDLSRTQNDMKAANKNKSDLNAKMQEIQEASAIDTSDLETEEQDFDNAIEQMERQLPDVNSQLSDLNNELKSKQDEKKKLDKKKAGIASDITSLELELSAYKQNMQNAENNVRKAKRDADTKEKLVKSLKDDLSKKDAELEKKILEAEEGTLKLIKTVEDGGEWDGQPLELGKNESDESIKKEIEKLKKKEEEEKKKHGLQGRTEAEVSGRYRNAKADYDTSRNEYASLQERLVHLEADYKERKISWKRGLKKNALKVKKRFDQYLNYKGLSGTAKFNHGEKTLDLICRTDNTDENTTCTDVRQLSGGEKSYTTLSLLFALGHVSECPFRLMDEYDVFMDEGSRKLSLEMLTEYAFTPEQKSRQFIIITPNNLNHVKTNPKIKIIQMQPPDRRERSAAGGPRQRTLEETF